MHAAGMRLLALLAQLGPLGHTGYVSTLVPLETGLVRTVLAGFNLVMPDNNAQIIADAIALLAHDRAGAEEQMTEIAYPRAQVTKRPSIPRSVMVKVYQRDCWTCRYCGLRTIFYPVMPLLGLIFPEQFPYHSNWKAEQAHPAVAALSSTVDHVVPGAAGGEWLAETNLVTACWPCNARKGDLTLEQLRWQLRPPQESDWDGLAGSYWRLWEIAGKPTNEAHPLWLRALGETTVA
jgi:5-methylcytosine-specific restriction endonuclease McrA